MTTPSISFSGLASGIDSASIIKQLTEVAQKPITLLQGKDDAYNAGLSAWQQLNSNLSALQTAAVALTHASTYSAASATSSSTAVATITTLPGATLGDHSLTVTQLAQSQKVVSASVASGSTALGKAGSFLLNGKTISVSSTDALSDISVKINAAKAGISATVVNVGPNDFRLTLTSNQSGAANTIAASDTTGGILGGLGILGTGAAGIRQSISGTQNGAAYRGAASLTFGSATQSVGSLLGITAGGAPNASFHITNGGAGAGNEADVSVDLNTASLSDVASAINKAGIRGITAEVVTLPDVNGNLYRIHQLQIVSSKTTPATASTATASGTSLTSADTFSGALTVNGQAVTLAGHATTLAQLNAAIQGTSGNSGVVASVSAGALVLTDASGKNITAGTTGLDNWTGGTTDNGPLGAAVVANGTPATATAPTFTDPSGVLGTLGVLQNSYTQTVTSAQDAKFNLDGLDLSRSSNTVGDVIPGATVKLLSGTVAAPGTTNLHISQNSDSILAAVSTFTSAYNAIQDFVTAQNQFTPPTDTSAGIVGTSAVLFGDSTLNQIQDQLSHALTAVSGSTTLESIGVTLDTKGDLHVNSDTLTKALQTDPTSVSDLFSASGKSGTSDIQFVQAGPKTAPTSGTGYAVAITQPATQSSGTAGTAYGGTPSTAPETLSFGGALFPAGVKLTFPVGSTIQDTVSLINNTSSLNSQVYARLDAANHLVISSQRYGSGAGFSVSSDSAADATNSGIGPALIATFGVDVAGTINGEPATGTGRTLTGNAGNAKTEGLQLLVSATAASPVGGATGSVTVNQGVADGLNQRLTQILDTVNGSVAGAEASLNSQISDTQAQISQIQTDISTYKDYLTQMFSDMETRVSMLQAQGSAFAASIGSVPSTSSSSGSLKTG